MNTTSRAIREEELLAHMGWVRSLARSLLGDTAAADDVTQEAWLRARTHGDRTEPSALRVWLGAVTRTLARDSGRARRRRVDRERTASRPEAQTSTFEVVERSALQQVVADAVMALEEPYRSTILYRYFDELDCREIAERTGASPAAVRQRLTRGRRLLRARLDGEFGCGSRVWLLAILGELPVQAAAPAGTTLAVSSAAKSLMGGLLMAGAVVGWQLSPPGSDGRSAERLVSPAVVRADVPAEPMPGAPAAESAPEVPGEPASVRPMEPG